MAKVKPGRTFKYPLESLLKVREIKEQKEQEKFAQRKKEYLLEKQKEDEISNKKRNKTDELRNIMKKGVIKDFFRVLARRAHLGLLKEELDKQVDKVIDASSKLEDQRDKLMDSMKNRKIIEKDKEHKLSEYSEAMKQLEIKFMDEISSLRFKREKKGRGS